MGKGYNNFMSKKAFHPGSYANQLRVRKAEEEAEAKRKQDEEKLIQYQKEQELFTQKSLVSKQSKERLSLNFMYEPPPGVAKSEEKQGDKVEWKGSTSKHASISNLKKESSTTSEPSICLEWKRERPGKKATDKLEVKPVFTKTEPKVVKTEPNADKTMSKAVKTEPRLHDTKRFKKE